MLHYLKIKQNVEKQDGEVNSSPKKGLEGGNPPKQKRKIDPKEDKKTSSVFENLILLPDNMVWDILRDSCSDKTRLMDDAGLLCQEETDKKSRRFWPYWNVERLKDEIITNIDEEIFRVEKNLNKKNIEGSKEKIIYLNEKKEKANNTLNENFVEPDVFLRFEKFDVIIEAKYNDNNRQYQEQWNREITAYRYNFREDKKVVFIAVGGNETYANGNATDLNKILEAENTEPVYKCSWQDLLQNVSKRKDDLKKEDTNDNNIRSQLRILDNIILAFNVNGVYTYKWLDYMTDSIENIKFDTINSTSIKTMKNFTSWIKEEKKIK